MKNYDSLLAAVLTFTLITGLPDFIASGTLDFNTCCDILIEQNTFCNRPVVLFDKLPYRAVF